MKRSVLVTVIVIAALATLIWAGVHNARERRLAAEKAKQEQVVLVPDSASAADAAAMSQAANGKDAGSSDEGLPKLRGKAAPAFTLSTFDGKRVSLADYKGKAVLVNFWATWCAPCKVETPWIVKLREQYAAQGFEVLGVDNPDDDMKDAKRFAAEKEEVEKFATKQGMTYPILIADDKVGKQYGGIEYLPTSYYVGRDGRIVEETAGLISKDEIEANIKKALATDGGK